MLLSVVIPVYNEEQVIDLLLARLKETLDGLDCEYEVLFVDDGSKDNTYEILRRAGANDRRIKALSFSRNFGHQMAITAGLDFAAGDAVVVMDADLQDPPELLKPMLALFQRGYDIVSPQRVRRQSESFFKRITARWFYLLMRRAVDARLQPEVGDFRLMSSRVVAALRSLREQHRFMRGMVASLGFKEALIPFEREARAAGETKYPLRKMLRFAWTAVTSFSGMPLRVAVGAGLLIAAGGVVYLGYTLYVAFIAHEVVPGWSSLVVLQCIFSGSILVTVGLVGDYIARIYEEVKGRPLYVVQAALNITNAPAVHRAFFETRAYAEKAQIE